MRVQPLLPIRPLTASVTFVPWGAVCLACNAANSPAPPVPRIRISVSCRSMSFVVNMSYRLQEESCGNQERPGHRRGCPCLLRRAPGQPFERQKAQAAEKMHREQKNEAEFGCLDNRHVGQSEKGIQPGR